MSDLADVRRLALALPATTEKLSYGTPAFFVRGKLFARLTDHEGALMVRCADLDEKDALLAAEPGALFTVAHYDGYPSVLVRLEQVAADELAELLTDAWRTRAPVTLLRSFDA